MTTLGPRPMPRNLRLLVGGRSASPDRMPDKQPTPAVAMPKPPRGMDKRDRTYWREFTSRMAILNCSSTADAGAIELWVKTRRRWKDATENIEKYGMLIPGGTPKNPQPRRNPLLTELHRCEATMLRIECEFGMTPSSRTRVTSNTE